MREKNPPVSLEKDRRALAEFVFVDSFSVAAVERSMILNEW